jgi:hypothetical protein
MADKKIAQHYGNILYIEDPNNVNINPDLTNAIPQYQDMHIFAELLGYRKGRTVLVSTKGNNYNTEKTGLEDTVNINFLGVNQNKDNPNYLKFTTNYYDGSTGNQIQYESFGMTSIKVIVNSSFVPQVNIQFVDIRGLSFFNQENSPYRILFDFPPPVFELTIKGYYGKSLRYRLHLVKYSTEFLSENGNFVIDAQFIAVTFAPLSDVLFRYAINFPLMEADKINMNPDANVAPRNTNELILKLKNLYSSVSQKMKTDSDSKLYDNTLLQIGQNTTTISMLDNYKYNLGENGTPYLFIKDISTVTGNERNPDYLALTTNIWQYPATETNAEGMITPLPNLLDYDAQIKKLSDTGVPSNMNERLYVGFEIGINASPTPSTGNIDTYRNLLLDYRARLLKTAKEVSTTIKFNDIDITPPVEFNNNFDILNNNYNNSMTIKYIGIDVTDFYLKLYKESVDLNNTKAEVTSNINDKINSMILQNLGMKPTIYNIFKIILDDVDNFYRQLAETSNKAENEHHNIPDIKKLIMGDQLKDSGNKEGEKIFAFPLMIDRNEVVCGGIREKRVSPISLNQKLPKPFPETELVLKFIESFSTQRKQAVLANMKAEENEDGTSKWIPISPFDSTLSGTDVKSPYYAIDTSGGGSTTQPINTSPDKRLTQILKIVLNRFYILTQNTIPDSFYDTKNKDNSSAYVELFAESEAVNLASSAYESNYNDMLKEIGDRFGTREPIDNFYTYLNDNPTDFKNTYDFDDGTVSYIVDGNNNAYVDKANPNYQGVNIYSDDIIEQVPSKEGNKPIDKFAKDTRRGFFERIFKNGRLPEASYTFTKENVLYIKDDFIKDGKTNEQKLDKYDGISLETRFVIELPESFSYPKSLISPLSNGGNSAFSKYNYFTPSNANALNTFGNVIDLWVDQLSTHDTEIYSTIINNSSKLSALLFLSNFGCTLGPFNLYPNNLNNFIFQNTAAIDCPMFLPSYIGALVEAADDPTFYNDIYTFFNTGAGKNLESSGVFIFADIYDITNYLSAVDKNQFKVEFDRFYANEYKSIMVNMPQLYSEVQHRMTNDGISKKKAYEILLNPNSKEEGGGTYFPLVLQELLKEINIIIFSQYTFKNIITKTYYESLKKVNTDTFKKSINDNFFKNFFITLEQEITLKQTEVKEKEEEEKKLTGDEDIITQTYYSFKNINDKWLCNPEEQSLHGYPFDNQNKNLIDLFAFVDRAMNPIGNTVINPEILIDLFDDTDISVFTVLSQLLSANGFLFFPLQNFMNHASDDDWEDAFKIYVEDTAPNMSAFVCMFIGGSSSYPTGINNGFKDDGITDITAPGTSDFNTKDCTTVPEEDNQVVGNSDFPYRQVRAFRIKFGEQNQSMFTNIKIDSKQFPETNESLKILARLAGDNKLQAPIPKGQNLYNVYENRAYKATIIGLGNAMIQPTQYFQLDNVPLFNGAYIILTVEHQIEPNKMTTTFSGTKILQYPVPRVLNPAAVMGFTGGDSNETSIGQPPSIASQSPGQITMGVGTINAPDMAKYNSMYTQNIQ